MEIWKNLNSPYEEYMVSNKGRIKNKFGKIMKTNYDKHGYERFVINKKGYGSKNMKVHRLVAEAFILNENITENTVVNHIDGNKKNNDVSNLEWTTYSGNNSHAIQNGLKKITGTSNPANKYSEEQIRKICELLVSNKELSNPDIVRLVFKDVTEYKDIRRLSKLVSQIKTKDRWSTISDEYFK